jgi:cyclic beta-1,2-glucan synthetase
MPGCAPGRTSPRWISRRATSTAPRSRRWRADRPDRGGGGRGAALALAAAGDDAATRDPGHWLIGPGRAALERAHRLSPAAGLRCGRPCSGGWACGLSGGDRRWPRLAFWPGAVGSRGRRGWSAAGAGHRRAGPGARGGQRAGQPGGHALGAAARLPGLDLARASRPTCAAWSLCRSCCPTLPTCRPDRTAGGASPVQHRRRGAAYALLSDGPDAAPKPTPQDAG